jgi:transcription initiation factor TFIIIB Brf1 subunit/transcription initiation factor TFIIB
MYQLTNIFDTHPHKMTDTEPNYEDYFANGTDDGFFKPSAVKAGKPMEVKALECTACGAGEDEFINEELLTCTRCGTIQGRQLDTTAEYRFFSNDDRGCGDPSRIGAPLDHRLPQSSLSTVILPSRGGSTKAMAGIRRYHQWNMLPYKERTLLSAFDRLSILASNHGISTSILEEAKEFYITLNGLCDRRGLSRDSLLASCVYTALKKAGSPRKPQEVGAMFSLSHASFTKAFKFFQEVYAMAVQRGLVSEAPSVMGSTRAADYVQVALSKLPVSRADYQKLCAEAVALADTVEVDGLSPENTPPSLAAGVVAYVCERWRPGEIPLARIASACSVSIATLQKCLRRLHGLNLGAEGV